MPQTKTAASSACASRLKTLADDTRLQVVRELMQGPKHVGEINETLKIEQSLLSHHLKVLKDAKIIRSRRDGKSVLYSLSPDVAESESADAIDLGCCLISFDD